VIVGFAISGLGFVLMGASPTFLFIAGGQAVWGVGWTFISGAREAWLTDEIGVRDAGSAFVRAVQISQIARLLGIPIAVALASVSLQAPLIVGGVLYGGLGLLLLVTMTEAGYTPASRGDRNTWASMGRTLQAGVRVVRGSSVLVTILLIGVLYGASSEAVDRLDSLLLIETIGLPGGLTEVQWFGLFGTMLTIGSLAFALAGNIWVALAALWVTAWVRVAIAPLTLIWLNRGLRPGSRATVISMLGQSDALGQTVGGPVLGLVGTLRTVRSALVGVGLVLLPALGFYGRELVRGPDEEADEAAD
jgi:DHA3 family tetracycline resistance protein-like MFS transporter